jgi:hypothetical protein
MVMNRKARRALTIIRQCVDDGRYRISRHFTQRLDERGLVWADVMTILESPTDMRDEGADDYGRAKWRISGSAANGLKAAVVCAIGRDSEGHATLFITIHWMDAT